MPRKSLDLQTNTPTGWLLDMLQQLPAGEAKEDDDDEEEE